MIKINTNTLEATREPLPKALKGLTVDTLQNLQSELNPVPTEFLDIEYWPEVEQSTSYDQYTQYLGEEILTVDAPSKTVTVSHVVMEKTAEVISQELVEKKQEKIREISSIFSQEVSVFQGDTPLVEVLSWGKQETEARGTGTSLLAKIALARGISVSALKAKVIAKADLWNDFYGPLLGKKQGLEDSIEATTTLAEVEAIIWEEV